MSAEHAIRTGALVGDDFELRDLIARGGMGAVYAALQRSTGETCVVKVMHAELLHDERSRERFTREAELCAKIRHEHVVRVIASGIDHGTDTPWIAMELVEGEDLDKFFRHRGAVPVAEACVLLAQLYDAVGAAHRVGVVHRDLKPSNVLLASAPDETKRVKVLDFGISKQLFEQGTETTAAVGSPLWMAPEQAQRGRLTPATDVFALAMITFRMLTGRIYWRSGAQARPAMKEMLMELLVNPLPPASGRARELDGAPVPPGFDAWFDRAASRDPARRFGDAHTAWESLAPVLDPTRARHEGPRVEAPSETPDEDAIATVAIAERRERSQVPIEASPMVQPSPMSSPLGVKQRSTLRSPTPTPLPELIDAARVERMARSDPKASRAFAIATAVVLLVLIAAVMTAMLRARG